MLKEDIAALESIMQASFQGPPEMLADVFARWQRVADAAAQAPAIGAMVIPAEMWAKLEKAVEGPDEVEWPDDIHGACGGNYDDALNIGVTCGEQGKAKQIREILGITVS